MSYTWVPVLASRYIGPIDALQMTFYPNWYPMYGPLVYAFTASQHRNVVINYLVSSVVDDFREAVGAFLYDEAKDDSTLVPIGCLIHIDAIIYYEFYRTSSFGYFDINNVLIEYMENRYRDARRRATIYRRELGVYLKKSLGGEVVVTQELSPTAPAVPFYTNARTSERSL